MEYSSDGKVRLIRPLVDALFEHVLHDEEPIFVGDEATLLDVSLAPPEALMKRCSEYYHTTVSMEDLRRPLWQLLPDLERRRRLSVV